jgi:hypothetical protein
MGIEIRTPSILPACRSSLFLRPFLFFSFIPHIFNDILGDNCSDFLYARVQDYNSAAASMRANESTRAKNDAGEEVTRESMLCACITDAASTLRSDL